jgi:predicted dithiol-disulfide oxidoreductase (DUF899 family)
MTDDINAAATSQRGPDRLESSMDNQPKIVSAEEWEEERAQLLVAEKEATRLLDGIAARRRRLPMVAFGPDGFCPGCTHFTNSVVDLSGLAYNHVSWSNVSNMPSIKSRGTRARCAGP